MQRKVLIIFVLVISCGAALAQIGKLVQDEFDEPLVGDNVVVKNATKDTVSDLNRNFIIESFIISKTTVNFNNVIN